MYYMINTLDDFIKEFEKIRNKGWITTNRKGPTGIGKTLEDLLGIPENNKQEPDFGEYELKSARKDDGSMLTLITKSPSPMGINKEILNKFGYTSSQYGNNKKVIHATLNAREYVRIADTGYSLKIKFDEANNKISIYSLNNNTGEENEETFWDLYDLKKKIESKIKNKIIYVTAESNRDNYKEELKFENAYLCEGVSPERIFDLLKENKMFVDIRIGQYENGKTHDHGTAFRIRPSDHHRLFNMKKIV